MHPFKHDFYGHEMSVLVLGYIRPELDYISKGAPSSTPLTDRGAHRGHPVRRQGRAQLPRAPRVRRVRGVALPHRSPAPTRADRRERGIDGRTRYTPTMMYLILLHWSYDTVTRTPRRRRRPRQIRPPAYPPSPPRPAHFAAPAPRPPLRRRPRPRGGAGLHS